MLVLLTALAYASPQDPSWIRGLYDGGDFDDVMGLLTQGAGVVDPFPLTSIPPPRVALEIVLPAADDSAPATTLASNPPRAPPAS